MISFLIALVILGAVLYVLRLLPIDATVKQIIYVVAVVFIAIYAIKTLLPMANLG